VVAICAGGELGMILGALPFLQLDRTGIALLGAIALVGIGALTPEQAAESVQSATLLLLFSFMVIAAQMRLGGFLRLGHGAAGRAAVATGGPARRRDCRGRAAVGRVQQRRRVPGDARRH